MAQRLQNSIFLAILLSYLTLSCGGGGGRPPTFTLTLTKNGNGTVISSPAGINCGTDCSETYSSGTTVTLTATPDPGWQFVSWSGDPDCTDGQVTMNADKTCSANFNTTAAGTPWAKTYGGGISEVARAVQQTSDGGYIVAGSMASPETSWDFWVLKLNAAGDVLWQKIYGGENDEFASSIQQTSDGGFVVAGVTLSFGAGGRDLWVLKLDASGTVLWQKTYGGADDEEATAIQQTSDGGFIVAGETRSFGGSITDAWVLKLNAGGDVTWQKTYGGGSLNRANSIRQTSDGGYIVAGETTSFGAGVTDVWVLKLNAGGSVLWQKTYGGAGFDTAFSIQQTSDGGYIVAGETDSFGAGFQDAWVLKLDAGGDVANCTPPDIVQNSSGSSADTSGAASDSTASPIDSSATITNTTVAGQNSSASTATQCTG